MLGGTVNTLNGSHAEAQFLVTAVCQAGGYGCGNTVTHCHSQSLSILDSNFVLVACFLTLE